MKKNFRVFEKSDNDGFHVIYRVLGLKLKVFNAKASLRDLREQVEDLKSRINRDNADLVAAMWETYGCTDFLLKHFDFISHSRCAWQSYFCHFWLIWFSCLLESGQVEKAERMIDRFLAYRNGRLDEFERFLPVSKYMFDRGIYDERVMMAAKVHETLEKSRGENQFKNLLEGKRVAVVGNAPSEIGRKKGAEIDAHDLVIRFNNYRLKGFEGDYGSKTDIWVRGSGGSDVEDRTEPYRLVAWEADYDHWRVAHNHLDILYRQLCEGQKIYNFDWACHMSLRKASGVDFPTTGMVLIWEIFRKFGNFNNVDFYGFSFCQDKFDTYATHYFNDRTEAEAKRRSRVHRLDKEAEFLQRLVNGKGNFDEN